MSQQSRTDHTLWTTIRDLHGIFKKTAQSRRPDVSFAGEYGCLASIVDQLGLLNGFVVDIGASDGVSQSSTLGFLKRPGWTGLAIEGDGRRFSRLAFVHARRPDMRLARAMVTPENVVHLLRGLEVPRDFSVLNLDIDGYDLHVMRSLLDGGFRPAVVSMEINELIAPPIYFTVDFAPDHSWNGDRFFGCSTAAAHDLLSPLGYVLHSVQYNNAVFVNNAAANGSIPAREPLEAWRTGYLLQDDRRALFPWNEPFEHLLGAEPDAVVSELHRMFAPYAGRYTLRPGKSP